MSLTSWLITIALLAGGMASAQVRCTPGTWTIVNQPPDTCIPFAVNGIFTAPLPNAGSGGPMNHLFPNSDAILSNVFNSAPGDLGTFRLGGVGDYFDGGTPIYYGTASDPVYRVNACFYNTQNGFPSSYPMNDPIGKTYHIPDKALFSNSNPTTGSGFGDQFLVVWDQVSNQVLGAYCYACTNNNLPHCTATTPTTACPTPSNWRSCDQANWSTDKGFWTKPGATGALDVPGWEGTIRTNEWMNGAINHALYLNTACEGGPETYFPDFNGPAGVCATLGKSNTNRPFEGNLVFLDYTYAQINAMNLPAWQKPIIVALTHYGGYIGDTGSGKGSLSISRSESNQAYFSAGLVNPLYAWLCPGGSACQPGVTRQGAPVPGTFKYQMTLFGGIPNVVGPNCPSSACDVISHMHMADPCIPLGFAGMKGGCASAHVGGTPRRRVRVKSKNPP
jgi:hypothetical protein